MSRISTPLLALVILFLSSCNMGVEKEQKPQDEIKATEEPSAEEVRLAIRKLADEAQNGIPAPLDFNKEHHYLVFKHHLKRANYTKEDHPQLYASLERAKQMHKENGGPNVPKLYEIPSASQVASGEVSPADMDPDHAIIAIHQITTLGSDDGTNYNTSGLSAAPAPIAAHHVYLGMYDKNGDTIGPIADSVTYGSSKDINVETIGTMPAGSDEAQTILTYFYEDSTGTPYHGYVVGLTSAAPDSIKNVNPAIQVSGNTEIIVCLGREKGNCDYDPVGGSGTNVILPITGTIWFGDTIDPINSDSNNVSCLITLARTEGQGGGCMVKSTTNFFADPNTVINGNELTWDLNPAHFEPVSGCLVANQDAIYTFTVSVTINELPVFVSITNAPDAQPSPYFLKIPNMGIFWSCLPTGSQITMADGSTKLIENISANDEVLADTDGRTVKVHSVMQGKDDWLYTIRAENGAKVRMTEGHTVLAKRANKQVILAAKDLRNGDYLITLDGESRIEKIEKDSYGGAVWNLVIDQAGAMDAKAPGQSTYFADGVLVGDSYMQRKYGKDQILAAKSHQSEIPERWSEDYRNYLKRRGVSGAE